MPFGRIGQYQPALTIITDICVEVALLTKCDVVIL